MSDILLTHLSHIPLNTSDTLISDAGPVAQCSGTVTPWRDSQGVYMHMHNASVFSELLLHQVMNRLDLGIQQQPSNNGQLMDTTQKTKTEYIFQTVKHFPSFKLRKSFSYDHALLAYKHINYLTC